jgi:hypothetical protein
MFLVLDTDGDLAIYKSVVAAEADLEMIDIQDREYEFSDETGQAYAGEVLRPTAHWLREGFGSSRAVHQIRVYRWSL